MSSISQGEQTESNHDSSRQESLTEYYQNWLKRIQAGNLGYLPLLVGLLAIAIIFGVREPIFFVPRNFVNLLLQMAGITTIAIGVVFVLLIAEIDLSVGYVSGVGSVVMVLLLREEASNWPWPLAMGAALLTTTLIGLFQGYIITKFGIPSFVVTLAGLLAWSGIVLIMTTQYSNIGTISIQDDVILGIANSYLTPTWGWILVVIAVGIFAFSTLSHRQSLRRQNLVTRPFLIDILSIIALMVVAGFAVWYANLDRGVPVAAVIVLVFLVFWSFVATRTKFGRYVYAVGGNPEAARRAGIDVDRIRITVFMIASFMAGVGGIILASRLRSVDTNSGGGNLMLNVIAAAVIGGTSLFGGSGRVSSALLGALVIAAVENGMVLLSLAAGTKFVVNGLVLLAAVLIDAVSRRSREA